MFRASRDTAHRLESRHLSSGNLMNTTLRDDDCQAVDLLLDRGAAMAGGKAKEGMSADAMNATSFSSHAGPVDPERLRGVQRVLGLLDALPESEPAPDLVERTLARIEQWTGQGSADSTGYRAGSHADSSIPHA